MEINAKGSIHPLMLALLMVAVLLGYGTWAILRHWRSAVATQLRLDQCVGKKAHELRDTMNALVFDNKRIREVRIALAAATLKPIAIPPLKATLLALVAHQEFYRAQWTMKQIKWLSQLGCGKARDAAHSLPSLGLTRLPADALGSQPLEWSGGQAVTEYRIQAGHSPRFAAAVVRAARESESGTSLNFNIYEQNREQNQDFDIIEWRSYWAPPNKSLWANIP